MIIGVKKTNFYCRNANEYPHCDAITKINELLSDYIKVADYHDFIKQTQEETLYISKDKLETLEWIVTENTMAAKFTNNGLVKYFKIPIDEQYVKITQDTIDFSIYDTTISEIIKKLEQNSISYKCLRH